MKASWEGLHVSVLGLWIGAWALWLATGLALPVPPWRASEVLSREEAAVDRWASEAGPASFRATRWSVDVGGALQARALGRGWGVPESFLEPSRTRTFAWIDGDEAEVTFVSPGWPEAQMSLRGFPLDALAPLAVDVSLDGQTRARIVVPPGWNVTSGPLGPVSAGRHVLTLRPAGHAAPAGESRRLSLAVDGISVAGAPVDDPDRDTGVFPATVRVGLTDRAALVVSRGATTPDVAADAFRKPLEGGLVALYGFGAGGSERTGGAVLEAIHGLLSAALLVLVPGLAWTTWRAPDVTRLAVVLSVSTLALLAAFVALRLLGLFPGAGPLACALALLGGAPLLRHRPALALPWRPLAAAAAALPAFAFFATSVVPPLEDQDMEVQATAHALATRQVPSAVTNRGTTSFFAHPPLLHVWTAGAFALSGRLARVVDHETAAREAAASGFVEPQPDTPVASRPHHDRWRGLLRRFLAEPHLWPTRQVNVLLAALAVGALAHLAGSLAGSPATGVALASCFATFPEVLVRGAYGGYFAATTLLSLLVLAQLHQGAGPYPGGLPSALATLSDQKGLLVPAAWVLAAPWSSGRHRLVPLAGAAVGFALFAVWGLATDAPAFVYDFVREHVVRRLAPGGIASGYPSAPALWHEFGDRYGLLFTAWAGLAALAGLRSGRAAVRAASAAVFVGAVVFSLTDWRQTKHLSLLAAPGLLAIAGGWPAPGPARRAALAGLALVLLHNLRRAWPLLSSFESLRPSAGW